MAQDEARQLKSPPPQEADAASGHYLAKGCPAAVLGRTSLQPHSSTLTSAFRSFRSPRRAARVVTLVSSTICQGTGPPPSRVVAAVSAQPMNRTRISGFMMFQASSPPASMFSGRTSSCSRPSGCRSRRWRAGAGVGRPAVWRWQARHAEQGVDGLLRDKMREPAAGHRCPPRRSPKFWLRPARSRPAR